MSEREQLLDAKSQIARRRECYADALRLWEMEVGQANASEKACFRDGFGEGYSAGREAGRQAGLEEAAKIADGEEDRLIKYAGTLGGAGSLLFNSIMKQVDVAHDVAAAIREATGKD